MPKPLWHKLTKRQQRPRTKPGFNIEASLQRIRRRFKPK